jgi:hypothetical protein
MTKKDFVLGALLAGLLWSGIAAVVMYASLSLVEMGESSCE